MTSIIRASLFATLAALTGCSVIDAAAGDSDEEWVPAIRIAAGTDHSCALLETGEVPLF
jgi:hypothetical protein